MSDEYSEGYEEAVRLIEENYQNREEILDLSQISLSRIPPELFRLIHLEELYIGDGEFKANSVKLLKTLPKEIALLQNLKVLDLTDAILTELPEELLYLENLSYLSLHRTQIKQIGKPILELKNLEELYLGFTEIEEIPKEISRLHKLQKLYLFGTKISVLPKEIGNLTKLKNLSISDTEVKKLPKEIGNLRRLKELNISGTQIDQLPKEILELEELSRLNLSDTHLNIPPEIAKKLSRPKIILNYYFENLVGTASPLNEVKMLILGEGEVGKSALVHRLVNDKFETTEKTEGIDIHKWDVEVKKNCNVQINIWDFAGQEITHATHQFFLTKRSLYLLVLASRGDEKSNRLEEWLKIIQNLGGDSPVIIVCNKSDEHQMNLDERALREKYPNIREIVKASCKKGTNIKSLKQKILKEIRQMPHVFDPFSKKWFAVKQKLEDLKENYIPFEKYLEICDAEGVIEDIDRETLIKFLHDLGVVLNFRDDKRLNDTNVLKPEWITEGVYKILTSKTLDDAHGVLTLEMVGKILDNRRYPKHKHFFIIQMMRKFERCFPLKKEDTYLVPDLLPKQQPDFGGWRPETNGLGFQYHYEIEPGSFITRFIVNMNEHIEGENYWRKGVVLKNADGNRALIKTDLADKIIFIWIDGKMETRRGFLSTIRRQFEQIHETMLNLKVTEHVQHEKGLIPYESLLKLEKKGVKTHYFPDIDADVNVSELLNGIETIQETRDRMFADEFGDARNWKYEGFSEIGSLRKEKKSSDKTNYDVALSCAGEDSPYVSRVAEELRAEGIKVFYYEDEDEQIYLWGKNLFDELDDIYSNRSEYVVMFISKHYAEKMWTDHERQSAFDNAIQAKREYVLPARFDDTKLKGLRKTISDINLKDKKPEDFARMIVKKLRNSKN